MVDLTRFRAKRRHSEMRPGRLVRAVVNTNVLQQIPFPVAERRPHERGLAVVVGEVPLLVSPQLVDDPVASDEGVHLATELMRMNVYQVDTGRGIDVFQFVGLGAKVARLAGRDLDRHVRKLMAAPVPRSKGVGAE